MAQDETGTYGHFDLADHRPGKGLQASMRQDDQHLQAYRHR